MNRRLALKQIGLGSTALVLVGSQAACGDREQLEGWALTGLETLKSISPVLALIGSPAALKAADIIDNSLPTAEKLKEAFAKGDNVTAGNLLASLISPDGWIPKIADALKLVDNDKQRAILLGSLAAAQVFYRLISVQVKNDAPAQIEVAMKSSPHKAQAMRAAMDDNRLLLAFETTRF